MTAPAKKSTPGTLDDLARVRMSRAVELIDGEIVEKAAPSPAHGSAQLGLGAQLFLVFNRRSGRGGPGGWWLMTEVEVYYDERHTYRHDIVGWKRERSPQRPSEMPVRLRPDWVCEVLSPSNAGDDLVKKLQSLHLHGVPHYWIADPEHRTLTVMRWSPEPYLTVLTAAEPDVVRAEPFETTALRVEMLFEHDDEQ